MTRPAYEQDRMARLLREYLLETLSPARRAEVEQKLLASREWRAALELERGALERLDALPESEPPGGLTAKVMAGVKEEELRRVSRPSLSARIVPYAVAAALLCIMAALLIPGLSRSREASRRASSQNNLKQMGIVLKMYANESKGEKYPPVTQYEGVWMLDLEKLYPEFLADPAVLVNPSHPDAEALRTQLAACFATTPIDWEAATRIAAKSYTYAGWMMDDDEEARLVQLARAELGPDELDEDLKIAGATVPRLREGVERFLITDINNPGASVKAQALVPVMFETIESAGKAKGINVLYMDGHVEFVPLGTKFPAVERVGDLFGPPAAPAE